MDYKSIITEAKKAGLTNESTMWDSIEQVSNMLETLKEKHSGLYWQFMHEQYGILFHNHYGKEFAEHDVSCIEYTDKDGISHSGPHWTIDQITELTSSFEFDSSVTPYDKYVAFNAAYADLCKHFDEEQIIQMGYDFFFADEDWKGGPTKVWQYMRLNYE